jgi:hypothetical protein
MGQRKKSSPGGRPNLAQRFKRWLSSFVPPRTEFLLGASVKTFVKSAFWERKEFPLARRYYSGYYAQHLLLTFR